MRLLVPSSPFCLSFHPLHPHLLAVGLHCGRVAIFHLQKDRQDPWHLTTAISGRHSEPVWAVAWHPEHLQLFSAGGDGVVGTWTLVRSSLHYHRLRSLPFLGQVSSTRLEVQLQDGEARKEAG